MDITTPLRTPIKVSDTHGWAAGRTGIYLGYNAQYDNVKVGFVNEVGEYTGEYTKVPRSAVSVIEATQEKESPMTNETHVKNVLQYARKAGFVVTHHGGAVPGVAQLNHDNGNVLIVSFSEGAFVSAEGSGWGDAPWTSESWATNDPDEYRSILAGR